MDIYLKQNLNNADQTTIQTLTQGILEKSYEKSYVTKKRYFAVTFPLFL